MSNETDLDWLARNVHVWPAGEHQPWCYVSFNGRDFSISKFLAVPGVRTCRIDKADWLARRAELQNKPSWKDAPEWAEWLAQDEDGEWKWLGENPSLGDDHWTADELRSQCKGVVIGDWRDTLEKRPEEFQPFTSMEDNQEKDMKQDSGWFERGELPPVGVECEIVSNYLPTFQCEIVEYSDTQVCIRWKCDFSLRVIKLDLFNPSGFQFRPIRQDYQVIADIVRRVPLVENGYPERIADAILAAGFSLMDK